MKYSISTCSFYKFRIRKLLNIPDDMGVEIFYEFGSEDQWDSLMSTLKAQGNQGPFSIHAPFAFVDISEPCDEQKLFDVLCRPFDVYHRNNGEFYVLHTYGEVPRLETPEHLSDCRKLATERLSKFQDICKAEGVCLAAENLCAGNTPMFNGEQFLQIFHDVPDIHCVIDVGHALVTGLDIELAQKTLGERICAYHLHNNDGTHDSHSRLRNGVMGWSAFMKNVARYTPNATGVLEYMVETDMDIFKDDAAYLEGIL